MDHGKYLIYLLWKMMARNSYKNQFQLIALKSHLMHEMIFVWFSISHKASNNIKKNFLDCCQWWLNHQYLHMAEEDIPYCYSIADDFVSIWTIVLWSNNNNGEIEWERENPYFLFYFIFSFTSFLEWMNAANEELVVNLGWFFGWNFFWEFLLLS